MTSRFFLLTFSLVIFLSGSARSIDETAIAILRGGPAFISDSLSLRQEMAEIDISTNLPDPELSGEFLSAPWEESDRWGAVLSWGLEWPGVYNARKKQAASQKNSSVLAIDVERRNRLIEIKSLLLDYVLKRKKLALIEKLYAANDTIDSLAHKAAKAGEITLLDLNKIKLDNASLRGARATMADELAATVTSLSVIYGKDCRALIETMECEFPAIYIPDAEEAARMSESAPDALIAAAEASLAKTAEKVAKMETLPGITFGYKYAHEDAQNFNGAVLGLTLPLFSSRHKTAAAKAAGAAAEYKETAAKETAHAEITATIRKLTRMKEQIAEIGAIINSNDYNSLLLKAYENKVINLIDYLSERNYFTNATIEFLDLEHSAAVTSLDLQKYLLPY